MNTTTNTVSFVKIGKPTEVTFDDCADLICQLKNAGVYIEGAPKRLLGKLFPHEAAPSTQLVYTDLSTSSVINHSTLSSLKRQLRHPNYGECDALAVFAAVVAEPDIFKGMKKVMLNMKPIIDFAAPCMFALMETREGWSLFAPRFAMNTTVPNNYTLISATK